MVSATPAGTTSASPARAGRWHQAMTSCCGSAVAEHQGSGKGREVVQAYVSGAPGGHGRPVRVLGGFGGAVAAPGETAEVAVRSAGPGVRRVRRDGRASGPGRPPSSRCRSGAPRGTCGFWPQVRSG